MHNVSGEQAENMEETMHTDAWLTTNDDETLSSFHRTPFPPAST